MDSLASMHSIDSTLDKIMADLLRKASREEAPLLAWPIVCGAAVADRTQAETFSSGTLTVRVPDAAWRSQLSSFQPQYLSALQRLLPGAVKEIVFTLA